MQYPAYGDGNVYRNRTKAADSVAKFDSRAPINSYEETAHEKETGNLEQLIYLKRESSESAQTLFLIRVQVSFRSKYRS